MSQVSQVIEILEHFSEDRPSSTETWSLNRDDECPELLKLWHIDHLILVYDMRKKKPLWKWWEEDIQKQGLEDALTYIKEKKIRYRDYLK